MKRAFLLFLAISTAAYAKVDPADFTFNVHVTSSNTGKDCRTVPSGPHGSGSTDSCKSTQMVKATIDGKTYDLMAETYLSKGVLPLGDYKARVVGKDTETKQMLKRKYELLMEDGSTRKFKVTGEEE